MSPSTTVAPAPRRRRAPHFLPRHRPRLTPPDPQRPERRPEEENNLHDPHCKARLQHRTGLVQIICERVPCLRAIEPERAQGDVFAVAVPVSAVRVCDEAQFVDAGDEGAEEEEVDEGDKDGGAFCGGVADHRVNAPEDGDDTDDEEDEDVDWGDYVGFEEAVDEVGQHPNDWDQEDDLNQPVEDEKQGSNHFAFVWSVVEHRLPEEGMWMSIVSGMQWEYSIETSPHHAVCDMQDADSTRMLMSRCCVFVVRGALYSNSGYLS